MTRADVDPRLLASLAAVGCAVTWAFTVLLYKPVIQRFGAGATNLFKCALAACIYGATIISRGDGLGTAFAPADTTVLALLMLSGVLGLTVSDTALFVAFRHIGTQRSMLIQGTNPVFTALLALAWHGETLRMREAGAAAVTMAGVMLVVLERGSSPLPGARPWLGYSAALIAAITQALGILAQQPATKVLDLSAICFTRTATAALVLVVMSPWTRAAHGAVALLRDTAAAMRTAVAAVLGTWIGLMLQSFAIGRAPAGIVSALMSTTPVFLIPFSFLMERERHGARAIAGTLIAVAGVVGLLL
jgi:drug/metabolite transporter (DMT)-like permease